MDMNNSGVYDAKTSLHSREVNTYHLGMDKRKTSMQLLEVPALVQTSLEMEVRPFGCYFKPSEALIRELTSMIGSRKVLEVFAGNGLLAACLKARGVDITATTLYSSIDGHDAGVYTPAIELDACSAVAKYGPESDILLICWPTVTNAVLHAVELWSDLGRGQDVIYIGEVTDYAKGHLGGCATDDFFEHMQWHSRLKHYVVRNEMEKALVGHYSRQKIYQSEMQG